MANPTNDEIVFVQYFSLWKTAICEILLLGITVPPMMPGFADGLSYRMKTFFTEPPTSYIPKLQGAILGLGCLLFLRLIWLALRGTPVLEITRDRVTTYGFVRQSIARRDIRKMDGPRYGAVSLHYGGPRTLDLPIYFYRDTAGSLRKLQDLFGSEQTSGE